MQIRIALLFFFIPFFTIAQVDVFNSNVLQIGLGKRHGTLSGIIYRESLSITQSAWTTENADVTPFHCAGGATDIRFTEFSENGVFSAGLDGIAILLSGFPYTKSIDKIKLSKLAGSHVKELPAREHYLTEEQARYWNWRMVDINALFGKRAISGGFHISLRDIGLHNFTYYQMQYEPNWVVQNPSSEGKILGGAEIGYRKSIGNLSFLFIGGVNSCLNHNSDIVIKWNPFFKPTVYFGKKAGVALSLYYEKYIGTTYQIAVDKHFPLELKTSQLEVCLGIYITKGK